VEGFLRAVIVAMRAPVLASAESLTLMDFSPHQSILIVAWQVPDREGQTATKK
jgi:hypothetical protein